MSASVSRVVSSGDRKLMVNSYLLVSLCSRYPLNGVVEVRVRNMRCIEAINGVSDGS